MLGRAENFHQGILPMNITILDFAIVAVPLVILLTALRSCVRASLSRQMDEVSHPSREGLPKFPMEER